MASSAEERPLPGESREYAGMMSSTLSSSFLLLGERPAATHRLSERASGEEQVTLEPLFLQKAKEKRTSPEDCFCLFRKRLPSRFAYDSWAKLQTGYGEFFPGDTIGRVRKNGVGIEAPHWFYLKMSLWF